VLVMLEDAWTAAEEREARCLMTADVFSLVEYVITPVNLSHHSDKLMKAMTSYRLCL
jgi:hypothetical protein